MQVFGYFQRLFVTCFFPFFSSLCFCVLQDERNFPTKINNAVFPALQGGPHEHQIAGVATQLLESMTPEFKEYVIQARSSFVICFSTTLTT